MAKFKELKTLSNEELKSKLVELRKELMKQNAQIAIGTVPKSPGKVKQNKKTVAQILMILSSENKAPVKEKEAKKTEDTKKTETKNKRSQKKLKEE
jgi:large subunit ribosomal protein L29